MVTRLLVAKQIAKTKYQKFNRKKNQKYKQTTTKKMFPQKHKSTIYGLLIARLHYLLVLVGFCVLSFATFLSTHGVQHAYAATSSTLNFQGRLYTSSGSVVPDGYYNIQFKLYDGGTDGGPGGTGQANSGTNLWTESYYDSNGVTAGNDNRLRVVNGYFSANLGSQTAFPGTINWDQELWLTMNVGGTTQTATPTYDGEMLQTGNTRTKLTGVPYAFQAGTALGVTSNNTSTASTNSGNVTISTGNASGSTSNSGNLTVDTGTATGTTGTITIGGTNASGIGIGNSGAAFTLQGSSSSVINAIAGGNTTSIQFQSPTANVNYRFATAAAGNYDICTTAGNCLGVGDIIQGGNTYGAAVTIGTNDNYGLNFEVNNTTVQSFTNTGGVTFKNTSNSTTAFQIQNTAAASLFTVDTTYAGNISLLGNNSGEVSSWVDNTTDPLPANRFAGGTVVANGYIYVIGGGDGSAIQDEVYYAKLNADGSNGAWSTTTALPNIRSDFQATYYNGYIYVTGGYQAANVSTVLYAQVKSDGTLGSWQTASNALPAARADGGTVAYNGYLYYLGGQNGSIPQNIYFSKLNANGSPGAWSCQGTVGDCGTAVNANGITGSTQNTVAAVANGYIYLFGGNAGGSVLTRVQSAKVNADGTTGAWANTTSLPDNREFVGATIMNGYAYAIAGRDNSSNATATVYYAALDSSGGVGSWTAATNDIPANLFAPYVTNSNGYIYVIGGKDSSVAATVYYASTARIKVGGSLDLVGYSGENLAEGGSGGQLTAGNTKIIGTLDVQDQASFNGSLLVRGNLTNNGYNLFQNSANSTTAFQIQNAAGSSFFTADSINKIITTQDIAVGTAGNVGDYGRLFSEDFEAGVMDKWTGGTVVSGTSTASPNTTQKRNGKFSSRLNNTGTGAASVSTRITGATTTTARSYIYISSQGGSDIGLFDLNNGGSFVSLYLENGTGRVAVYNTANSTSYVSTNSPSTGSWHLIEMNVTYNAATGSIAVYVDGTQVINETNINTGVTLPNNFRLGETNAGRAADIYYDDIAVDTVRPGDSASIYVSDSLHVAGSSSFGGQVILQPGSDVTNALMVQDASRNNVLTVDTLNKRVSVGAFNLGYPLGVQSATTSQALFQSTGTNRANIVIDNAAGSQQSSISLQDAGSDKWQLGKDTDNSFFIYNVAPSGGGSAGNSVSIATTGAATFRNQTDTTTAFQIQNAAGSTNLFTVDTTNGKVGIGAAPSAGGQLLQVNGAVTATSYQLTSGNVEFTSAGNGSNAITKGAIADNAITANQVVVITGSNGSNQIKADLTTIARDKRVFGVAANTVAGGGQVNVKISGTATVDVDTSAVSAGDQLVTSTTSGRATVDNSATTGILGYATSTKAGGSNGTVTIIVRPINGQYSPTFRNASDSTSAFQVQNAAGSSVFNVDTTTGDVSILADNSIRLDGSSGSALIYYDTGDNSTYLTNYNSGGTVNVQADAFYVQDTTGYNTNLLITNTGATTFKNRVDSAAAFQVQTSGGSTILGINSNQSTVGIGAAGNATDKLFVTTGSYVGLTVNQTGTSNIIQLQDNGTNVLTVADGGAATFRNQTDSTTALQVQRANGSVVLSVDTSGLYVINNGITRPGNLLENAGAESNGTTQAAGWNFAANTSIATNAATARTGNRHFQINASGATNDLSATKYYAVAPGDQIYFEYYARTTVGADGTGGVWIQYLDKDFASLSFTTDYPTAATVGTSYSLRSVTATAPANTAYIQVAITVRNSATTGSWYFDDLYLKKVNEQSPVKFQNSVNSTTAFQIQNANGDQQFLVNTSTGAITLGDADATGTITLGQSTASNTISIGSAAGNGNTQTINIGTSATAGSTTNVTIGSTIAGLTTLQSQGGVAVTTLGTANTDTVVCRNSSNILSTCSSTFATNLTAFFQGGNSFSAPAVLGTNDSNSLSFETNNQTQATIAVGGATTFKNSADSTAAFQIQNANAQNLLLVNTSNGYVINNGYQTLGNELQNPSFEAGPLGVIGNKGESGWYVATGNGTFNIAANNARTGNNSVNFTANSAIGAFGTFKYFEVQPGENLYTEMYAKSAGGANGDVSLCIEFVDENFANPTTVCDAGGTPGGTYELRNVTTTVPAGYYYASPFVFIDNNATTGTFYFDDFYIKRATEQAPMVFQNSVDSTTAFQIQNASGVDDIFTVDTSNRQVTINESGTTAGTGLRVYTASGNDGISVIPGTGQVGESAYIDFNLGRATVGYNGTTGDAVLIGESGKGIRLVVDGSVDALDISTTGQALFKNGTDSTTAFQIQNAAGTNLVSVNSTAGVTQFGTGTNYLQVSSANGSILAQNSNAFTTALTLLQNGDSSARFGLYYSGGMEWGSGSATRDVNITRAGAGILQVSAPSGTGAATLRVKGTAAQSTTNLLEIQPDGSTTNMFSIGATGAANFRNSSDSTTAFQIQNAAGTSNTFVVDTTNNRIGIGTAPSTTLDIRATDTSTSGFLSMAYLQSTVNPGGASSTDFITSWNRAYTANSAVNYSGSITGLYQEATHAGTGTIAGVYGSQNNVKLTNSGTITNAYALTANLQIQGAGTVNQYQGLTISNPNISGGGTLNNNYGIYIVDQNAGSSDYGLYIEGADTNAIYVDTGDSYFGDSVTVQTTTNSTTAFQIQDTTGTSNLLIADTTNNRIGIGAAPGGTYGTLQISSTGMNDGLAIYNSGTKEFGFSHQLGFQVKTTGTNAWTNLGTDSGSVDILDLYNSSNVSVASVSGTGAALFKNSTNSTAAFDIQNTAGDSIFIADTTNGRIGINTSATSYDLSFGGDSARTIGLQTRSTNAVGSGLTISAGAAGSGGSAFAGGVLSLQGGGAAGTGNANGGAVTIAGGAGVGTGTQGLVNLSTTAFTSASEQSFSSSTSITAGNVDLYSSLPVKATTNTGLVLTVPDPNQNTVIGRLLYVAARSGSLDFTLRLNSSRVPIDITMKANSTATLIWNGTDWTAAGASSSTDLQAAYNNTIASAGGAELVLNAPGGNADGLTIRNNATTAITGGLLEVQTSIGSNLFTVNNNATEYANNGGAETAGASSTTFPSSTWSASPNGGTTATVSRDVTAGEYATGQASVKVVTTGATTANQGAADQLAVNGTNTALTANLVYTVSFTVKGTSNFSTLDIVYSRDGTNTSTTSCATGKTVTQTVWTRINCTFTAPSSGITSSNAIFIRQSNSNTVAKTFYIDNLSVNVNASTNHAADGSVDSALGTNWTQYDADGGAGTTTIARDTTNIYDTSGAVSDITTAHINEGMRNNLTITPQVSTQYLVTFYAKLASGTFTDLTVGFLPAGGNSAPAAAQLCTDYNTQTLSTSSWTKITCYITTPSSGITDPDIVIYQPTATARTFYVDALSVTLNTNTSSNVQIGGGNKGGPATLFTLDRSNGAPIADNNDAYLGSMYYDTTSGRIQCYEADGWGACGAAPDNIVNLNPEYAGAVLNGTGVGTMTADFCSNDSALSVNSTLCSTGQAKNYYRWTSPQATTQTYSIYVTYQLPATFNGFSSDDTVQLVGRVDSTSNAAVTYEMYKSTGSAVTQCGSSETDVITGGGGSANTWYSYGINGNEATGCSFSSSSASNFVIFKINLKAKSNANAYVSTLSFTTTGR